MTLQRLLKPYQPNQQHYTKFDQRSGCWCFTHTLLTVLALEALWTQAVVGVGQIDACAIVLAWIGQAGLLILFITKLSEH